MTETTQKPAAEQNPAAIQDPIAGENPLAKKSFLRRFFAFDEFITARILKIVYILGVVLILLATVGACGFTLYSGLDQIFYNRPGRFGLFDRVLQPLFYLIFYIIYYVVAGVLAILVLRLYCEFIMVIFKINENLQGLRNRSGQI